MSSFRDKWRRKIWQVARAVLRLTIVCIVFFPVRTQDLFSRDEVAVGIATRLVSRWVGTWYSYTINKIQADSQYGRHDRVAVILIGSNDLQSAGQQDPWPPNYAYYSALVDKLIEKKVAGIMLDIAIQSDARRGNIDVLVKAIEQARKVGIWVVLGSRTNSTTKLESCSDGSLVLVGPVPAALGCAAGIVVPFNSTDPPALLTLKYPRVIKQPDGRTDPSLAWTGWKLLSSTAPDPSVTTPTVDDLNADLFLLWGQRSANCKDENGAVTFIGFLRSLILATFPGRLRAGEHCIYLSSLSARDLDTVDKDILAGRAILIGGNDPTIHDEVVTPDNLILPGVFVHAAGLDNFIIFGEHSHPRFSLGREILGLGSDLIIGIGLALCWTCLEFTKWFEDRLLLHSVDRIVSWSALPKILVWHILLIIIFVILGLLLGLACDMGALNIFATLIAFVVALVADALTKFLFVIIWFNRRESLT